MASALGLIIELSIGVYFVSSIVPGALTALFTAVWTSVPATLVTLATTVVGLAVIFGIVLNFLRDAGITLTV